jgi:hypothetical protein
VTETTTAQSSAAQGLPASLPARLAGVLYSPRAAYAAVAAQPRWLGALAIVLLLSMTGVAAFLSTEVGQTAMLDQQIRQAEAFTGRPVSDAQYQRLEQILPYAPYLAAGGQLVFLPLAAVVLAGVAVLVFNAILGADAAFRQVFAVIAHSGIVIVVAQLLGLPLTYVRQSLTSPANLGVFAPFLDEASFAARFLSAIDLFYVWWLVSLAIGLGVLYRKRTAPIATSLLSLYVLIALIVAVIRSVA